MTTPGAGDGGVFGSCAGEEDGGSAAIRAALLAHSLPFTIMVFTSVPLVDCSTLFSAAPAVP
jgi:hypothetical protein